MSDNVREEEDEDKDQRLRRITQGCGNGGKPRQRRWQEVATVKLGSAMNIGQILNILVSKLEVVAQYEDAPGAEPLLGLVESEARWGFGYEPPYFPASTNLIRRSWPRAFSAVSSLALPACGYCAASATMAQSPITQGHRIQRQLSPHAPNRPTKDQLRSAKLRTQAANTYDDFCPCSKQ